MNWWMRTAGNGILGAAMLFPLGTLAAAEIAANGRTEYVLDLPENATVAERTAAAELKKYFRLAVGTDLPDGKTGKRILIGQTPEISERLGLDFSAMGDDELVIAECGDALILTGGRPRGTLYAVLEFLEQFAGVRFYAPDCVKTPKLDRIEVPEKFRRSYAPVFVSRDAFYKSVLEHPEFAAQLRLNGHWSRVPEQYGGRVGFLGGDAYFCHTFRNLISKESYFAAHPEYFSLIDGKRNPAQLCLTNSELRREMTAVVLKRIAEHPESRVFSLTQNDGWKHCQCAECTASDARYGSPAGTLLAFLNPIADAVKKQFPDITLETLAYVYTQHAPNGIAPRDNLQIRLCSIQCDFARPLASEANAEFRNDLLAWSRIAPKLAVWNYLTDFSNYLLIQPNWDHLAPDLRFMAAKKVVSVFEQGDIFTGPLGDWNALRTWLTAKLLWNPDSDAESLMTEFMTAYYGPAAGPMLLKSLNRTRETARRSGAQVGCYRENSNWIGYAELKAIRAERLAALETVAADPILRRRVADTLASPTMALLLHRDVEKHPEDRAELITLYRELQKTFRDSGIDRFCEWSLLENTWPFVEQNLGLRPRPDAGASEDIYAALQDNPRAMRVANWSPDVLHEKAVFPLPGGLPSSGKLTFWFVYRSGPHAAFMKRCALLEDGREVAADAHNGFSGTLCRNHIYRIPFTPRPGKTYALQVDFNPKNDTGATCVSNGEIWLIGD